jgi:tyrosine-protein kinase Etk/Wzc
MLKEDISKTNDSFERYKERITNFSGEFELGLFLFISRRSLILIIPFLCLVTLSAFLYLRYTPPVFESHCTLQIQTSNQATDLLNVSDFGENKNLLSEGIELLRSKVLFKNVLSHLPLETSYFSEGTFKANELYTSSPFNVEVKIKNPKIKGNKIYIDFINNHQFIMNYVMDGHKVDKKYETERWVPFPDFDIKVNLKNYKEIETQQNLVKKQSYYIILNDTDALVEEYYPRLEIKALKANANTILISFKDLNSQKAADIVTMITNDLK